MNALAIITIMLLIMPISYAMLDETLRKRRLKNKFDITNPR